MSSVLHAPYVPFKRERRQVPAGWQKYSRLRVPEETQVRRDSSSDPDRETAPYPSSYRRHGSASKPCSLSQHGKVARKPSCFARNRGPASGSTGCLSLARVAIQGRWRRQAQHRDGYRIARSATKNLGRTAFWINGFCVCPGAAPGRRKIERGSRIRSRTLRSHRAGALARSIIARSSTSQPAATSSLVAFSTSLWLMPSSQGTNTMAVGATRER